MECVESSSLMVVKRAADGCVIVMPAIGAVPLPTLLPGRLSAIVSDVRPEGMLFKKCCTERTFGGRGLQLQWWSWWSVWLVSRIAYHFSDRRSRKERSRLSGLINRGLSGCCEFDYH